MKSAKNAHWLGETTIFTFTKYENTLNFTTVCTFVIIYTIKIRKYEAFPEMNLMTIKSKIQTINYGISAVNPIFCGRKITPCEMTTKTY